MTALLCVAFAYHGATLATLADLLTPRAGPLSWHLADIHWEFPGANRLRSVSVDLVLLDDIDQRHNLFIAPLTGGFHPREPFYIGQQTRLTPSNRPDGRGVVIDWSPGFVFSRWGDMDYGSVRPAPNGRFLLSDHEEAHASVKVNRPWGKGRYTYRLERGETVRTREGVFTWATASVVCHATGDTQPIGSLRVPGHYLSLGTAVGAFVEVYGYDPGPKTLPSFRLMFGNWRIDDEPMDPYQIKVRYPKRVPQVAEVKQADRFFADGECKKTADLPRGPDAVGVVIRPKPLAREPGKYLIWQSPYR